MPFSASPASASRDRIVRAVLRLTAPANVAVAGLMLAPTSSLARLAGLSGPDPALLYRSMLALFLALFGGAYGWLARQPRIDRPLLAFGAVGKSLAFTLTLGLWIVGEASTPWMCLISGDLVCAGVFAWWLLGAPAVE